MHFRNASYKNPFGCAIAGNIPEIKILELPVWSHPTGFSSHTGGSLFSPAKTAGSFAI